MPFTYGVNLIKNLTKNSTITTRYGNNYYPCQTILPNLVLRYPGKLKNAGDYRLELNGRAITHTDIVRAVHDCALQGNSRIISDFMVDLYKNGLNYNANPNISIIVNNYKIDFNQAKHLIYWLILQEDINYPRPQKMGVTMPLIRYTEGAIAALHPDLITLQMVFQRTNNHGGPPYPAFIHKGVTGYLTYNIQQFK